MSELHKTEVYALKDLNRVDLPRLYEAGYIMLSFDADKTLLGQEAMELPPNRQRFFRELGEVGLTEFGFQIAVVSNAWGARVDRVRSIGRQISELTGRECVTVVPSDVDGKKKPSAEMFKYALYHCGIDYPQWAMHFGDQVRADVVGAERAGYRTAVVVAPIGEGDDPTVRFVGRPFVEPILRVQRGLPLLVGNFPHLLSEDAYTHCR